jgi:hypothetical protein
MMRQKISAAIKPQKLIPDPPQSITSIVRCGEIRTIGRCEGVVGDAAQKRHRLAANADADAAVAIVATGVVPIRKRL